MTTDNLKLILGACGVASIFALVYLGKVDAVTYITVLTGALGAIGGHAVGKGTAGQVTVPSAAQGEQPNA